MRLLQSELTWSAGIALRRTRHRSAWRRVRRERCGPAGSCLLRWDAPWQPPGFLGCGLGNILVTEALGGTGSWLLCVAPWWHVVSLCPLGVLGGPDPAHGLLHRLCFRSSEAHSEALTCVRRKAGAAEPAVDPYAMSLGGPLGSRRTLS